ncbi:MAG: NAD(P)/FAD-dependent oxidoreductase [Cyclobacteriaceae bacterium]
MIYDVIVCGGGASGFFSAINIAMKVPGLKIAILEKTGKLLSKVRISGGGRCNVTNGRTSPSELVRYYPRGEKKLYNLMKSFGPAEMINWLNNFGVDLKTEDDLRVFPITNDSQTIIDCFMACCEQYNIEILTKQEVKKIAKSDDKWQVQTAVKSYLSRFVIIATGASPKAWDMIGKLPANITDIAPSLFTFNIRDPRINGLQGVAFRKSLVKIVGSRLAEEGSLLITHWGMSGPAILKLSAWGALDLKKRNYEFEIIINFIADTSYESFRNWIVSQKNIAGKKKISNVIPEGIVKRYWHNLLTYCEISQDLLMADLSKKQINKLTEECCQAKFTVKGKSTFKDEFVTCGGVALQNIDLKDMESKTQEGLYFTGEVLDIDGITGGFNFQACWATAWAVSESISKKYLSEKV